MSQKTNNNQAQEITSASTNLSTTKLNRPAEILKNRHSQMNTWINDFDTLCRAHRSILVTGNTLDYGYDHNNELKDITKIISTKLYEDGYDNYVIYNPVTEDIVTQTGELEWYDFVTRTKEVNNPNRRYHSDPETITEEYTVKSAPDFLDFSEKVHNAMKSNTVKTAIILDCRDFTNIYSDSTSQYNLSEEETQVLNRINYIVRNSFSQDLNNREKHCLFIVITQKHTAINQANIQRYLMPKFTVPTYKADDLTYAVCSFDCEQKTKTKLLKIIESYHEKLGIHDLFNLIRLDKACFPALEAAKLYELYSKNQ